MGSLELLASPVEGEDLSVGSSQITAFLIEQGVLSPPPRRADEEKAGAVDSPAQAPQAGAGERSRRLPH
jgi:predicted deacylase